MADLPGPKMRIGMFDSEPIDLKPGDLFTLTTDNVVGDAHRVSVTFARLPQVVAPGNTLYLNDGLIQVDVEQVQGSDVRCRVVVGGELRSRKGLNLPGSTSASGAFTAHDYNCMKFALENGVDAVSQSFVENAADIQAVRDAASALGYSPFIIAKIERTRALDYLDDIITAADAVMIARGDLGVELPIEQIPVVQKQIMRKANMQAKPVITATQMLESMTTGAPPVLRRPMWPMRSSMEQTASCYPVSRPWVPILSIPQRCLPRSQLPSSHTAPRSVPATCLRASISRAS